MLAHITRRNHPRHRRERARLGSGVEVRDGLDVSKLMVSFDGVEVGKRIPTSAFRLPKLHKDEFAWP